MLGVPTPNPNPNAPKNNLKRIASLDLGVDMVMGIKPDSSSDMVVALGSLVVTTIYGTPMHVLSGYLVGLEVTRQTHFMKVALYTFLIRSLFMINIVLWCMLFDSWRPIMCGEMAALVGAACLLPVLSLFFASSPPSLSCSRVPPLLR